MKYNTQIGVNVEQEFWDIIESVPMEILKIQGIANLDLFQLSDEYLEADTVAHVSIDANANVTSKSPVSYQSEIEKPTLKMHGYYVMWKKLRELYDEEVAKNAIKACLLGALYFHDVTKTLIPYCFAWDTSFLVNQGRPYGWLPSAPPKRSSSFMGQLVEEVMSLSQEFAGAIGLANALVNLAYFTRKERIEMHRVIRKFVAIQDVSCGIALYASSLGYNGEGFDVPGSNLEQKIETYIMKCLREDASILSCQAAEKAADVVYDKYVENLLQQFVHVMHNTFRVGGDSPFSNLSIFDPQIIKEMFSDQIYPDYTTAGDNVEEILHVQEIYSKFLSEGCATNGKNYRFPVSTVNIKKWEQADFEAGKCSEDEVGKIACPEFYKEILKLNQKRGAFNIHIGSKIASCCRLTNDLVDLRSQIKTDSFGNGGLSIGSHRVVAVNLHRMALLAKERNVEVSKVLDEYLPLAEALLVAHKQVLQDRINQGFLKYFTLGWCNLNMLFSTIGFTGLWDCYETISEKDATKNLQEYSNFAKGTLLHLDSFAHEAGNRHTGYAFNVEEIPGEGASPKMAMMDNVLYGDKYGKLDLLSNQMVPLYKRVPLYDRLETDGELMNIVSGGAIVHLNIYDTATFENYYELNRQMVEDYGITHYAINKGSVTCEHGHTSIGWHKHCPVCSGKIVDATIRVVGFNVDVSSMSKARQEEILSADGRQWYVGDNMLDLLKK